MKEKTDNNYYKLWIVFWICLFCYFTYEAYLAHQLKITKSNNEVKLKELEIQDKQLEREIIKNGISYLHSTRDSSVE